MKFKENNLIEFVENMIECFIIWVDEIMKLLLNDYIEFVIEIMKCKDICIDY